MNESPNSAVRDPASDEIDLRELFAAIWETRVPVVLTVLGFSVLFWIVAIVSGAQQQAVYSWEARIQFTFDGVEDGRYPNGTEFSVNDLLSPVVIRTVFDRNGLSDFGLTLAEFSSGLAIATESPTRAFIVARYQSLLERPDLVRGEIQELEQEFSAALQRASRGQALLTLTLHEDLFPSDSVVSDELAGKVLMDIPRIWVESLREEGGPFSERITLYGPEVLDPLFVQSDALLHVDILEEQFRRLWENIDQLDSLPNSGLVRDPETGLRLRDIRAWLSALHRENFKNLRHHSLVYAARSADSIDEVQRRMNEMRQERDLLERRADLSYEAMSVYSGDWNGMGELQDDAPEDAGPFSRRRDVYYPSEHLLEQLMRIRPGGEDAQFRQELVQQGLSYRLEAAELDMQIAELERLVGSTTNRTRLSASAMQEELKDDLSGIESRLVGLFETVDRIATEIAAERLDGLQSIVQVISPSTASVSAQILTRSNFRRFAIGVVLFALLSMFVTFLFNMLRERGSD